MTGLVVRSPDPDALADAFGLGPPRGPLIPVHPRAWRLETSDGAVFVKRVRYDEPDWWRPRAERGMAFERRALEAGAPMPRPVVPASPSQGYLARVDGHGPVRAYEWVDGKPYTAEAFDVSVWLGETMALLTSIEPGGAIEPGDHGLFSEEDWGAWLEEGSEQGRAWTSALESRLALIGELIGEVRSVLGGAADVCFTHLDVEPWNVIVTPSGPLLMDWDWLGPHSAWLVAAWSTVAFAPEDDVVRMRRTLDAYRHAGGVIGPSGRPALARRISLRLIRLSFNLWVSLGHRPATRAEREGAEQDALRQLESFPDRLRDVDRWAAVLTLAVR